MAVREFLVIEDPDHPGWLVCSREDVEIDRWLARREKRFWSRLVAFQIIFGSFLWLFLFGKV